MHWNRWSAATLWLLVSACTSSDQEPVSTPQKSMDHRAWLAQARSAISGRVSYGGQVPPPELVEMKGDAACHPQDATVFEKQTVIIDEFGALREAFVYIAKGIRPLQFPLPTDSVFLDQKGCQYLPHVFGIRAGQPLVIMNSDNTLHNVYASSHQNPPFNIGMTRHVKQVTRVFPLPEVMIPFRCNVHPWMSAYAGVVEHPYFQVTGVDGAFHLGPLPAGEYQIAVWHEKLGRLEQTVTLGVAETREIKLTFVDSQP